MQMTRRFSVHLRQYVYYLTSFVICQEVFGLDYIFSRSLIFVSFSMSLLQKQACPKRARELLCISFTQENVP